MLYYIKGKETLKNQGILAFLNAELESENNILELKYADKESDSAVMELEYAILERLPLLDDAKMELEDNFLEVDNTILELHIAKMECYIQYRYDNEYAILEWLRQNRGLLVTQKWSVLTQIWSKMYVIDFIRGKFFKLC